MKVVMKRMMRILMKFTKLMLDIKMLPARAETSRGMSEYEPTLITISHDFA